MQSGDPCPECGNRLSVLNTKTAGASRVRYLGCRACGHRPEGGRRAVPLSADPDPEDWCAGAPAHLLAPDAISDDPAAVGSRRRPRGLRLLTVEQAAELLAVEQDVLELWMAQGTGGFPAAVNLNGLTRLRADELAAWLDRQPSIGGCEQNIETDLEAQ